MAVPKKKTSHSRKGLRHAGQHHKLYRKFPMKCPNCGDLTLPHRACAACGTYKNREIFTVKAKSVEGEEQTGEAQS